MNYLRYTLKQKIGVLIFDWPKFETGLRRSSTSSSHSGWVEICNRNESLERAAEGPGVLCRWKWTSDLHAPKVFPSLGLRLMKMAFKDWPIGFEAKPLHPSKKIDISFVIGHRGTERLPHLLLTLQTIAAQRNVSIECIVVEQSHASEIKETLPGWVHYIHTTVPETSTLYCRSRTFNVGARAAKGDILVLHDDDILVPQDYALEIMKRRAKGYEVTNLKRFIFFLTERHSFSIISSGTLNLTCAPQSVMQNAEAGGSIAISRHAYLDIGGFDESFIGWGGEDNEFWERAQTRRVWPYGYLPLIHLWHNPQQGKTDQTRVTAALFEERSRIPVKTRIKELSSRGFGDPMRPSLQDLSVELEQ